MKKTSLFERIVHAILYSDWEPVETIIAVSLVCGGLMVAVPDWNIFGIRQVDFAPMGQIILGGFMLFTGMTSIIGLALRDGRARTMPMFFSFMVYLSLSFLAINSFGWGAIEWISYLALALISAVTYLGLRVGP